MISYNIQENISPNAASRQIIRSSKKAFLNTITTPSNNELVGWPAVSIVTVVAAWDDLPLLM